MNAGAVRTTQRPHWSLWPLESRKIKNSALFQMPPRETSQIRNIPIQSGTSWWIRWYRRTGVELSTSWTTKRFALRGKSRNSNVCRDNCTTSVAKIPPQTTRFHVISGRLPVLQIFYVYNFRTTGFTFLNGQTRSGTGGTPQAYWKVDIEKPHELGV